MSIFLYLLFSNQCLDLLYGLSRLGDGDTKIELMPLRSCLCKSQDFPRVPFTWRKQTASGSSETCGTRLTCCEANIETKLDSPPMSTKHQLWSPGHAN